MRESFTFGSQESLTAMAARLPGQYEMSLNPSDMATLIGALAVAFDSDNSELSEDAGSLLSSIAETLGIEMI